LLRETEVQNEILRDEIIPKMNISDRSKMELTYSTLQIYEFKKTNLRKFSENFRKISKYNTQFMKNIMSI